jgi:ferredoxin-NAD(P)+ reductase (naphthalene dioxygenase ferredoxin-specific)
MYGAPSHPCSMAYPVEIADSTERASAEPGETILAAMLRQAVAFSYSCQAGNCGSCRCELVDGEIFELPYSEHALSPAERARGVILACRSQVWGAVRIRRLADEDFTVHPSRVLGCRVASLDKLTHDIVRLRLAIENGGPLIFSAGQYAQLHLGENLMRDYSMANRPDEETLEFHVRVMPGGKAGLHVRDKLKTGAMLRVAAPLGTSFLRANRPGPILAIAGGTGLAPIYSIISTALAGGFAAPLHLYFGVRAERDVYYEDELRALADKHPNFRPHIVLSEPDGAGTRRTGFVTQAVAGDFTDLAGFTCYLAGPPVMVEAAQQLLLEKNAEKSAVHADAFYTDADRPK